MQSKNLINGQKPEFGNLEHIKIVHENQNILSGEINFGEIEWMPAQYIDGGGKTKPRFNYVEDYKDADCLVDTIKCPKCKRNHIILICLQDSGVWYEDVLQVDIETQNGFSCYNCGLEMYADEERLIYVKQRDYGIND